MPATVAVAANATFISGNPAAPAAVTALRIKKINLDNQSGLIFFCISLSVYRLRLRLICQSSFRNILKKSLKCSMEMYHSLRQLPLKRILSAFLFFIKKQRTSVILSIASEKREQAYEILYLRLPFIRGKPFTVVPNSIKNGVAE